MLIDGLLETGKLTEKTTRGRIRIARASQGIHIVSMEQSHDNSEGRKA